MSSKEYIEDKIRKIIKHHLAFAENSKDDSVVFDHFQLAARKSKKLAEMLKSLSKAYR